MEIERPHRTTSTPTTTSELFICFTSRLSKSSSMRLSSKSILSPAHTSTLDANKASQNHTLSSSLSRRLRPNGSLRGAQSPAMFPSKKSSNRGSSGFAENPEPSSPKVTCIGQVRVKTKKQGKKMKMRACRSGKRLSGGEASFRRIEGGQQEQQGNGNQSQVNQTQECELNHRNQRWVHLPLTICEALRAFGSEFSCLFPCKSSCFTSGLCGGSNNNESNEKREERESSGNSSCAVFRWLVSLQEGEEGVGGQKRRDIELVVGDEEEEVEERERRVVMERECSRRRSIFDDMEFDDLFHDTSKSNDKSGEIDGNDDGGNEEGGRMSICVPPKNALLLMRCRSDPMKMASLSRKLWDPPLPKQVDVVVDDDEDDDGVVDVEEERENVVEEVKFEEEVKKVEEEVKLEVEETELVGVETVGIEDEKEEIQDETEEIEGKIETFDEEMGEMLEDMELGESKIETLPDFVAENEEIQKDEHKESEEGEEEKQEEQETEEMQSIENSEEENCETAEETQFIEDETQLQEDEIIPNRCSIEAFIFEEKVESGENEQELVVTNSEESQEVKEEVKKIEEREESSDLSTTISSSSTLNSSEESTAESKEQEEKEENRTFEQVEAEFGEEEEEENSVEESNKQVILSTIDENPKPSNKPAKLPDCLLLMMCEPKLSMEVSKETWVCSTDFIRWLPERHHSKKAANAKTDGSDESTTAKTKKKTPGVGPPPQPAQPARSSISFPAGSVANLIEQKLVKAGGYEPFVLTRCKSAPMRSTAKIEPHRPGTFGVGKAGVGF